MMDQERVKVVIEEFKMKGGHVVDKVREVIEEGKARRITISREGKVLAEFPLAVGVGGAAAMLWLMPLLAAVGAIAALVSDVSVIIERVEQADDAAEVEEIDADHS